MHGARLRIREFRGLVAGEEAEAAFQVEGEVGGSAEAAGGAGGETGAIGEDDFEVVQDAAEEAEGFGGEAFGIGSRWSFGSGGGIRGGLADALVHFLLPAEGTLDHGGSERDEMVVAGEEIHLTVGDERNHERLAAGMADRYYLSVPGKFFGYVLERFGFEEQFVDDYCRGQVLATFETATRAGDRFHGPELAAAARANQGVAELPRESRIA
jgi:hypothetical protein